MDVFPSTARAHRNPVVVARKMALLKAPHLAKLTEFAPRIATERKADVPLFDPASGGVNAKVLLLLKSPGPASSGSGLNSPDNDDPTAANVFAAMAEAGLSRRVSLS